MKKTDDLSCAVTSSAFDFESRYIEVNGYQIHYVETGVGDPVGDPIGDPILFLHGNPTNSYTFRNVLKQIADATGSRCIALDLLGFGKSEKPNIRHNCMLHAGIIRDFIRKMELENITLVAEDWGGFLGGYVMTQMPHLFRSAVFMETFLWPMTYKEDYDPAFVVPFKLMRSPVGFLFSKVMNMMINKLIPDHCAISAESLQYYKDCVPTFKSRKAIGDFPKLLPTDGKPKESLEFALELQKGLKGIRFPVLWILADPGVVVSKASPIGLGRLEDLKTRVPQLQIRNFGKGYHFLSEENPEKIVEMVSEWLIEIRESINAQAS